MTRDDEYEDVEEEDEEEEDPITLQDVKDVADTVKSIVDAGIAVKKFTETSTPRPPHTPPNPNLPTGRELDKMIREAKENSVPRAFIKGSTKRPSPPTQIKKEKKEGKLKKWLKGFGKWIVTLIVGSIILYFFWIYVQPALPNN